MISSMISEMLVPPPKMKPAKAINRMIEFFVQIHQPMPVTLFFRIMNSARTGKTKARTTQHTEPMRLRSRLRLGTISATANVTKTIRVRKSVSAKMGWLEAKLHFSARLENMIWMATKNWIA